MKLSAFFRFGHEAVSYTHLDVYKRQVPVLPIFQVMQKEGNISEHDMFNTFNMGVGMCVVIPSEQVDQAVEAVRALSLIHI